MTKLDELIASTSLSNRALGGEPVEQLVGEHSRTEQPCFGW